MKVKAAYYQQFDADFTRDVPAEGYGGWKESEIEISPQRSAVVIMHAWDAGTREQYPGWHRAVEYFPRANGICRDVLPRLLRALRASDCGLFHVVGRGDYYKHYPGYRKTADLAGPEPDPLEAIEVDHVLTRLRQFRSDHVFVGKHNQQDVKRGFENLDFVAEAMPLRGEAIAENSHQLFALCKDAGVNHLIYAGFAVDGCLLLSPAGMVDMSRRGIMCSVFRQAVTAVENKESARTQAAKEIALWRVALLFGFVFDVDDFIEALSQGGQP